MNVCILLVIATSVASVVSFYAPASQVSNIRVYRGVSPVSSGQETIGGSVVVETKGGEFSF